LADETNLTIHIRHFPPGTGRFHEKDFTPITLNKYSLSQPAV